MKCRSAAWGKTFLAVCAVILSASLGFGQAMPRRADSDEAFVSRASKLAPELLKLVNQGSQQTSPESPVRVIVQFKQIPGERHFAKVQGKGGRLNARLELVRGGAFSVPATALRDLANDPEVAYIAPDREVRGALDNTTAAVNAGVAWSYGYDGTGIGVAVIDSGVNTNSDLDKYSSTGSDL